jgi:hypothetical protein
LTVAAGCQVGDQDCFDRLGQDIADRKARCHKQTAIALGVTVAAFCLVPGWWKIVAIPGGLVFWLNASPDCSKSLL